MNIPSALLVVFPTSYVHKADIFEKLSEPLLFPLREALGYSYCPIDKEYNPCIKKTNHFVISYLWKMFTFTLAAPLVLIGVVALKLSSSHLEGYQRLVSLLKAPEGVCLGDTFFETIDDTINHNLKIQNEIPPKPDVQPELVAIPLEAVPAAVPKQEPLQALAVAKGAQSDEKPTPKQISVFPPQSPEGSKSTELNPEHPVSSLNEDFIPARLVFTPGSKTPSRSPKTHLTPTSSSPLKVALCKRDPKTPLKEATPKPEKLVTISEKVDRPVLDESISALVKKAQNNIEDLNVEECAALCRKLKKNKNFDVLEEILNGSLIKIKKLRMKSDFEKDANYQKLLTMIRIISRKLPEGKFLDYVINALGNEENTSDYKFEDIELTLLLGFLNPNGLNDLIQKVKAKYFSPSVEVVDPNPSLRLMRLLFDLHHVAYTNIMDILPWTNDVPKSGNHFILYVDSFIEKVLEDRWELLKRMNPKEFELQTDSDTSFGDQILKTPPQTPEGSKGSELKPDQLVTPLKGELTPKRLVFTPDSKTLLKSPGKISQSTSPLIVAALCKRDSKTPKRATPKEKSVILSNKSDKSILENSILLILTKARNSIEDLSVDECSALCRRLKKSKNFDTLKNLLNKALIKVKMLKLRKDFHTDTNYLRLLENIKIISLKLSEENFLDYVVNALDYQKDSSDYKFEDDLLIILLGFLNPNRLNDLIEKMNDKYLSSEPVDPNLCLRLMRLLFDIQQKTFSKFMNILPWTSSTIESGDHFSNAVREFIKKVFIEHKKVLFSKMKPKEFGLYIERSYADFPDTPQKAKSIFNDFNELNMSKGEFGDSDEVSLENKRRIAGCIQTILNTTKTTSEDLMNQIEPERREEHLFQISCSSALHVLETKQNDSEKIKALIKIIEYLKRLSQDVNNLQFFAVELGLLCEEKDISIVMQVFEKSCFTEATREFLESFSQICLTSPIKGRWTAAFRAVRKIVSILDGTKKELNTYKTFYNTSFAEPVTNPTPMKPITVKEKK